MMYKMATGAANITAKINYFDYYNKFSGVCINVPWAYPYEAGNCH